MARRLAIFKERQSKNKDLKVLLPVVNSVVVVLLTALLRSCERYA